jgi:hypothetical protein
MLSAMVTVAASIARSVVTDILSKEVDQRWKLRLPKKSHVTSPLALAPRGHSPSPDIAGNAELFLISSFMYSHIVH